MFFKGTYSLNCFCKMNNKTLLAAWLFILFSAPLLLFSQSIGKMVSLQSPHQKIIVALLCRQNSDAGEWYIKASYNNNGKITEAIPRIDLGLSRSDQDFSKELKFLKVSKPILINEQYAVLQGKRSACSNCWNQYHNNNYSNLQIDKG